MILLVSGKLSNSDDVKGLKEEVFCSFSLPSMNHSGWIFWHTASLNSSIYPPNNFHTVLTFYANTLIYTNKIHHPCLQVCSSDYTIRSAAGKNLVCEANLQEKQTKKKSTVKICRYNISEIVHQTIKACNISTMSVRGLREADESLMIMNEPQDWRAGCGMWFMSTDWVKKLQTGFVLKNWSYFGFMITLHHTHHLYTDCTRTPKSLLAHRILKSAFTHK